MTLPRVTRVRTPATADELRAGLDSGYQVAFTQIAPEPRIAVAWAQCAFEHGLHTASARERRNPAGLGRDVAELLRANAPAEGDESPLCYVRGVFNRNIGNIDGSALGAVGLFETVLEREIIDGQETRRRHVRAAFATLADGCAAYWRRLRTRWPGALEAIHAGVPAFVHELKEGGYFTDREEAYRAGVERCLRVYEELYTGLPPAREDWP